MPKQVGQYGCVVAFYTAGQEFDWMANIRRLPELIELKLKPQLAPRFVQNHRASV